MPNQFFSLLKGERRNSHFFLLVDSHSVTTGTFSIQEYVFIEIGSLSFQEDKLIVVLIETQKLTGVDVYWFYSSCAVYSKYG